MKKHPDQTTKVFHIQEPISTIFLQYFNLFQIITLTSNLRDIRNASIW